VSDQPPDQRHLLAVCASHLARIGDQATTRDAESGRRPARRNNADHTFSSVTKGR